MDRVDLKAVLTGVKPGGCIEPYLAAFATELISGGYAALSIREYIRSAAHLGRWMDSRNMGIERLDETAITCFSRHKCQCPLVAQHGRVPSSRYVKRAWRFVVYLGRQGKAMCCTTMTPRSRFWSSWGNAPSNGPLPAQCLQLHRTKSGQTMTRLHNWLKRQFEERLVEPNSALGEAISYMLNHWEKLTRFLHVPGAPLDSNICERALKKAILHRKNALFYKT